MVYQNHNQKKHKKKLLLIASTAAIVLLAFLAFTYLWSHWQEKMRLNMQLHYILNTDTGKGITDPLLETEAEGPVQEIDMAEMRDLNNKLIEKKSQPDNSRWVELEQYPGVKQLFKTCGEDVGILKPLDRQFKTGLATGVNQPRQKEGKIITAATVYSLAPHTLLLPGNTYEAKTRVNVAEYRCWIRLPDEYLGRMESFGEMSMQIKQEKTFTVIHHPKREAIRLRSENTGLRMEDLFLIMTLEGDTYFASREILRQAPRERESYPLFAMFYSGNWPSTVKQYNSLAHALEEEEFSVRYNRGRTGVRMTPVTTPDRIHGMPEEYGAQSWGVALLHDAHMAEPGERFELRGDVEPGNSNYRADFFFEFTLCP